MTFGMKKKRMAWLPDGGRILKICLFVSAECTNMTDRQTDRQTDRYRLCIASRGKNQQYRILKISKIVYPSTVLCSIDIISNLS